MAVIFKNWIKQRFPRYFHDSDTNKDYQGQGFLMRYLQSFGEELDEEIYPYITTFMDLFDTRYTPDKLLGHLSFVLGLPPSVDNNFTVYRRVLAYAVQIYKIKGTAKSYELLFEILGLKIKIQEERPEPQVVYDAGYFYDENPNREYDFDCATCSYYSILYYDPNSPLDPVPQEVLDKFSLVICFLEPINAKLRGYVRTLYLEDTFDLSIEDETIGFNVSTGGAFDGGFDDGFDNG